MRKDNYFVSYASTYNHSFIIISKQIITKEVTRNFVIASFGLYGEEEKFMRSIMTGGAVTENGRIKSENFSLIRAALPENIDATALADDPDSGSEIRTGIRYYSRKLGVKSFEITPEQAVFILNEVKEDSTINSSLKDEKLLHSPKQNENHITTFLTPEEKDLYLWFKYELNNNKRGGPKFNGRDFNCKKYAIYILRRLGIRDPVLEGDRYPSNTAGGLRTAYFQNGYKWLTDFNVHKKPEKFDYPKSYYDIFNSHTNPIQGALAILEDYAGNNSKNLFFHYKRHHCEDVTKLIQHVKKSLVQFKEIADILSYIDNNNILVKHRDIAGSLNRRLDFLREHSCNNLKTKETKEISILTKPSLNQSVAQSSDTVHQEQLHNLPDNELIEASTNKPRIPLQMRAMVKPVVNNGRTEIFFAISTNDIPKVKSLAEDLSVDINKQDVIGWTPLHWAVHQKNLKIVKILLNNGANINLKNKDGSTPLNLCQRDSEIYLLLFSSKKLSRFKFADRFLESCAPSRKSATIFTNEALKRAKLWESEWRSKI